MDNLLIDDGFDDREEQARLDAEEDAAEENALFEQAKEERDAALSCPFGEDGEAEQFADCMERINALRENAAAFGYEVTVWLGMEAA